MMKALYEFSEEKIVEIIEENFNHGKITGRLQGSYGDIFLFNFSKIAIKCPKISRFGSREKIRDGLERAIREIDNTKKFMRYPGVHRFGPPKLILGWPFFPSQLRDGTLYDLIKSPTSWDIREKLAAIIQVTHTLNYCISMGLNAHQDLKPENIFIHKLTREMFEAKLNLNNILGTTKFTFVADFGIADAFRDIGQNSGSRPYMAPEQYSGGLLIDGSKIDIFALGVIMFMCFSGGIHPIGHLLSDIWPSSVSKWNKDRSWQIWANQKEKNIHKYIEKFAIPPEICVIIERCLQSDSRDRPSMLELQGDLYIILQKIHPDWSLALHNQIQQNFERWASPGEPLDWPYYDECILELKEFYADMK